MAGASAKSPCTVDQATWQAIRVTNFPNPKATVEVYGLVRCPSPGWTCTLTESSSKRGDSKALWLDLACVAPVDEQPPVPTDVKVEFNKVYPNQEDAPYEQPRICWDPPFSIVLHTAD